jgi:hypothetical protein
VIEQGGIVKPAFDAIDGTIDSITKTAVFSHCKPNPCLGVAIDHDLYKKNGDIDVYIEFLRCLKSKYLSFFSARWVSRYLGIIRRYIHPFLLSLFPVTKAYPAKFACA